MKTLIGSSCWNLTFPAWARRPLLPHHNLPILNPGTVLTFPILFPSAQLKQAVHFLVLFFYFLITDTKEKVIKHRRKYKSVNWHKIGMPEGKHRT